MASKCYEKYYSNVALLYGNRPNKLTISVSPKKILKNMPFFTELTSPPPNFSYIHSSNLKFLTQEYDVIINSCFTLTPNLEHTLNYHNFTSKSNRFWWNHQQTSNITTCCTHTLRKVTYGLTISHRIKSNMVIRNWIQLYQLRELVIVYYTLLFISNKCSTNFQYENIIWKLNPSITNFFVLKAYFIWCFAMYF